MDVGHYISGIGHGGLLAWALIGGLFSRLPDDAVEVTTVSIISSQDFAALSAPDPVPEAPESIPTPVQPEPAPPEEPEPVVEETPLPEPIIEETPPEPPQPPAEEDIAVLAPPDDTNTPTPAPRVAPTPVEAPPEEAEIADEVHEDTTEQAEDAPQIEDDPEPATAPQAANDRIVTEADDPPSSAPTSSARPTARPKRPTPPVQTAEPEPDSTRDAIADMLADVQAQDNTAPQSSAPTGPPLTGGEKDAFLVDVRRCWNVGALSTAALETKVVLRFELGQDGKPDIGSIRMTGFEGGNESVARQAYETARRAIIRCGVSGYNLPIEKYEQWKIVNITFNPENMRLK